MENPQGERKILSKFEDGLVYFTFTGLLPTWLWQYRAKLYTDTHITEEDIVTVDAVLSSQHELDFRFVDCFIALTLLKKFIYLISMCLNL